MRQKFISSKFSFQINTSSCCGTKNQHPFFTFPFRHPANIFLVRPPPDVPMRRKSSRNPPPCHYHPLKINNVQIQGKSFFNATKMKRKNSLQTEKSIWLKVIKKKEKRKNVGRNPVAGIAHIKCYMCIYMSQGQRALYCFNGLELIWVLFVLDYNTYIFPI